MSRKSEKKERDAEVVRVAVQHHVLVRWTHWINFPLLLGLIASGLAIYWAAPVFVHPPDPLTRSRDYLMDWGLGIARFLNEIGRASCRERV